MRLREGLLLSLALLGPAVAAQPPAPALTASAVQAAAEAVQADPLLPGKEMGKVLRFRKDEGQDPKKQGQDEDLRWWLDLLGTLSGGMRVAIWLVGAGILVWVLLRLRDWLRLRKGREAVPAVAPTHVGSLDIRPESLPADVGAAARALWQRGEARAALSLLYRGALSRLAHGHGVPIRAASTESECLALATARLAPAASAFLAQLIAGWQAVAYAQRQLPDADMERLCAAFDSHLPPAAMSSARPA